MFNKNSKMNLKSPIKKKKIKFKYIIYILIIYISFSYTFYYSMKNNPNITNEEFINLLLEGGNFSNKNYSLPKIVNKTVNFFLNIDFANPTTLLNNSILSIKSSEKVVHLEYNDDYSDMDKLKDISSYIEDPNPKEVDNPTIYIYNTHQLENYNNKNLEIYGITPNVLMSSYILKEKLNKLGIPSIVEDTNMSDFLKINGWDHTSSYKASRLLILEKQSKYPTLKYFIDVHRDAIPKNLSTINISNKSYAKILFVVGLENKNYQKNLELVTKLNDLFNKYYPGLSRGILKKEGPGVDGVYNQDLSPNSILFEVGGYDNTIYEVFNTIDAISDILFKYIKENKNE